MMRCAIYTRKSTEEGLTQPFNSLDAQRESAEAYILSQREAGWTALADRYDDGGHTGANVERPALRRLLTDIEAGRIDCVVVYKVDRLSRSLLDFARLMGQFDKRGISLVSVTQQFNTTASLGRLTLNILLSFAQFERELIAERTRDKMAAARRKGKWVGGTPVLGYDVAAEGGKLVVNEEEARQVRAIFGFFLEHRALPRVLDEIERRKWTTKTWTTKAGKLRIGRSFAKQDLTALLTNVIYTGKVHYQGQSYTGEHTAIVEEQVWQRAQDLLQEKRRRIGGVHQRARLPIDETAPRVETSPEGVPRIARLLALALKFQELIHQGVVKDYAELARLGRVSRARVTQIMNLLNLAPDIQERILSPRTPAVGLGESTVRKLSSVVEWSEQRDCWQELYRAASVHERPALGLLLRPATQP
jgi:DNA invertase Pin-like site-specific DNA recombinase